MSRKKNSRYWVRKVKAIPSLEQKRKQKERSQKQAALLIEEHPVSDLNKEYLLTLAKRLKIGYPQALLVAARYVDPNKGGWTMKEKQLVEAYVALWQKSGQDGFVVSKKPTSRKKLGNKIQNSAAGTKKKNSRKGRFQFSRKNMRFLSYLSESCQIPIRKVAEFAIQQDYDPKQNWNKLQKESFKRALAQANSDGALIKTKPVDQINPNSEKPNQGRKQEKVDIKEKGDKRPIVTKKSIWTVRK